MNKRWISMAAVVTLLGAALASAQPAAGARGHGGRGAAMAHYLELTPDQVTAWKQVRSDSAAEIKPLAQNAQDLRQQLDAAMSAATPDPAAVGKLSMELRSAHQQLRAAREATAAKLEATLTPEQKAKFEAFQAARKSMRPGRRGAA